MKAIEKATGLSFDDNKNMYLNAISFLMSLGLSEDESRKEVQSAYRESIIEFVC